MSRSAEGSPYEDGFVDALSGGSWINNYAPLTQEFEDYGRGHYDGAEAVGEFSDYLGGN